jgi:hypothetical protein
MNILHEKRKLLPHGWGNPQEPITAAFMAMGMSAATAAVATTITTSALISGTIAAASGGDFLKGALMGAVFAGVGAAVSGAAGATGATVGAEGAGAAGASGTGATLGSSGIGMTAGADALTPALSGASSTAGAIAPQAAVVGDIGIAGGNTALSAGAGNSSLYSLTDATLAPGLKGPTTGLFSPGATSVNTASSKGGLLDSLMNSGDRTKAAMIMAGGNVVKGFADGKAQEAMYKQRQADARYATPINRGLLSFKG